MFPPLPPGGCHWQTPDGTIIYASDECRHCSEERRAAIQQDTKRAYDEARAELEQLSEGTYSVRIDRLTSEAHGEWPSVLYENPADFFDDNQVIDA